jgi:hypothetical protein
MCVLIHTCVGSIHRRHQTHLNVRISNKSQVKCRHTRTIVKTTKYKKIQKKILKVERGQEKLFFCERDWEKFF